MFSSPIGSLIVVICLVAVVRWTASKRKAEKRSAFRLFCSIASLQLCLGSTLSISAIAFRRSHFRYQAVTVRRRARTGNPAWRRKALRFSALPPLPPHASGSGVRCRWIAGSAKAAKMAEVVDGRLTAHPCERDGMGGRVRRGGDEHPLDRNIP